MSTATLIVIILLIVLLCGWTPMAGGNFYGAGHPLGGVLGLVLVILLILTLLGRI